MKIYKVYVKCVYGRSPWGLMAYVEADSPKEAIQKYHSGKPDEELKYSAKLGELPEGFWNRAEHMREPYIK